jgi:flagellar hook-associated protein 2
MSISSPGIGSGLDVNSIVSKLMSVEQQPLTLLDTKEASYQSKITAYGSLQSALSTFQTAVQGLSDATKLLSTKATPADTTVLGASASSIAVPGSYSVEVSKLAQSQKLIAVGQASTTATIGVGTLSFDFGTISGATVDSSGKYTGATFTSNGNGVKTVTINASNNSLLGIRDAINQANIGVSATIVNDGGTSPYRLALTSTAIGQSNSMKITTTDAGLTALLGQDPGSNTGQNLSETITAQNAQLTVDGVAVSKTSNSVSDVIQGVTLNLLKTNVGAATTVTVAHDSASVTTAVNAFAKAYNDLNTAMSGLSSYDASTKTAGILQGDSALRTIQYQIRNTLSSAITGAGSSYTTLSSIGVSFQKDGTLSVDSTKLQSAIDTNFDNIAGLFAATGKATDSLVNYSSATANTKAGTYALNVTQLATQGKVIGSGAANLTITAGTNDSFSMTVDGVNATVALAAGTYTADTLASALQSAINGASAFSSAGVSVAITHDAGGIMTLTSNRYGSASNVSVAGNGASNLLGGAPAPASAAGVDVAGTINGAAAAGSGQYLTGAIGNDAEGLKVLVSGGVTGDRGTVNYSQGYAFKLDALVGSMLSSAGPITTRIDGANQSIKDIGNQRDALNRRLVTIEAAYRAQYTALDVTISNLTQTQSALTQELASIKANS